VVLDFRSEHVPRLADKVVTTSADVTHETPSAAELDAETLFLPARILGLANG
jgi:hypothetical protein